MFQKKYRLDPRKINDDDPRLIGLRADIVTGFFKELRAALDQEQQRRGDGKHIEISAAVLVNEINNLQYGVDLRRLINEGLMDELFIISGFGATRGGDLDLDFFREICRPKGTRFSPWVTNSVPLRQQIKTALAYYEAGAYGAYDSGDLRFGHVEELKWRLEQLEKLNTDRMPVKYYYFHRLGDNIRDTRYGCWWGG
jgi:hypothetical protein